MNDQQITFEELKCQQHSHWNIYGWLLAKKIGCKINKDRICLQTKRCTNIWNILRENIVYVTYRQNKCGHWMFLQTMDTNTFIITLLWYIMIHYSYHINISTIRITSRSYYMYMSRLSHQEVEGMEMAWDRGNIVATRPCIFKTEATLLPSERPLQPRHFSRDTVLYKVSWYLILKYCK